MLDLAKQSGEVSTAFEIRPATTRAELTDIATLRRSGYRLPGHAALPVESIDFARHAVVLGAFDKQSNQVLGTMRVLLTGHGPSEVSEYINLPPIWQESSYVEARHLCVPRSEHALPVKILLCKALYLLAIEHDCFRAVIATRPALQGFYRLLHFDDLSTNPISFTPPSSRTEHRVMGLRLDTLKTEWRADAENDTLYRIFFEQQHADLRLPGNADVLNPLSNSRLEAMFPPADIIPDAS